ncbi:hypothetical protein GTV32_07190 [Gordonia sp. SID5947]|uniref:hypothetical protein n=1 Tax=Gordonia sp. SID5947 TaxID=2690315 RepID=UPI00136E8778|nr:hypothetical protein [Gordonia sp. SID5947]MYR06106.1 hypothetical protein [Gordonia sp. SID5947]
MQTVTLETELEADAPAVWSAMLLPATFLHVCRGLFSMPALADRTAPMHQGDSGTGWLLAFHIIPAYRHTIEVVEVDHDDRTIRTREHGGVLRAWNHTLHVEPNDGAGSRYRDTIEIDAGHLTRMACIVAGGIFRYRQRRWRKFARTLPAGN